MKKMILALAFLACVSCNKNQPCSQNAFVAPAALKLGTYWQCQNMAAFNQWFYGIAQSAGVCTAQPTGTISNLLCAPLLSWAQKQVAAQVPAAAVCNQALIGANLFTGLQMACNLIPF